MGAAENSIIMYAVTMHLHITHCPVSTLKLMGES